MGIKQYNNVPIPILGLDVSKPGEHIDNRATPRCQNILIDRQTIKKRYGTVSAGTTLAERVLGIKELTIGTTNYVLRVGLTKIESYNQATSVWTSIAGTALTGAATDRISFATPLLSGARILVFTNGTDAIRKWTGTGNTAALGGTPPLAKYVLEYGSYLMLANVTDTGTAYGTRVQWCDTGAIETWGTGNAGSVDLVEDGYDITGMALFANYVSIHKETCIYLGYLVSSDEVFTFERRTTGVGAINNNTIQNLPTGDQAFLARDGIHLFNGQSAPLASETISDEIKEMINSEYVYKAWSILKPEYNEYWVAVPIGSQTEPDTIYKYNYVTGQCYKDYRQNISAAGNFKRTTQLTWDDVTHTVQSDTTRWDDVVYTKLFPVTMFGDSTGITTTESNINNDNGTAIDAYWESKDYYGASADALNRWFELEVIAKGDTVKVDYSIDGGITWVYITNLTLSSEYPADTSPLMCYFDVVSRNIRFRFTNNTASETFTLKQFTARYVPRETIK